jgi:galactose-1-phosphate uridylyltransferase
MTDLYYRKSWEYFDKNKTNYWQDLIKVEENGDRFIGKTGSVYWLTNFAPSSNNEIIGIVKGKVSSFFEMNDNEIKNISKGISKIFKCIYDFGRGYNMTIFSAPLNEHLGHFFSLNVKIISRPMLGENYDRGFSEILHKEPIIVTIPEDLAKDLRKKFK